MVSTPFFSPSTVTQMQKLQESSFVQSARLKRVSFTSDGAGGSTVVASFLGPYPCRVGVSKLQRGETLVAGQLQGNLPWLITLPVSTDVRLSDRINVDGALVDVDFVGGRDFEILAVYGPTSFVTAMQCICAER